MLSALKSHEQQYKGALQALLPPHARTLTGTWWYVLEALLAGLPLEVILQLDGALDSTVAQIETIPTPASVPEAKASASKLLAPSVQCHGLLYVLLQSSCFACDVAEETRQPQIVVRLQPIQQ